MRFKSSIVQLLLLALVLAVVAQSPETQPDLEQSVDSYPSRDFESFASKGKSDVRGPQDSRLGVSSKRPSGGKYSKQLLQVISPKRNAVLHVGGNLDVRLQVLAQGILKIYITNLATGKAVNLLNKKIRNPGIITELLYLGASRGVTAGKNELTFQLDAFDTTELAFYSIRVRVKPY